MVRPSHLPAAQGFADPPEAFGLARSQYESVTIMKALAAACPPDAARLLGLTGADIAIPMLSFLFGQAQFNGRVALVSVSPAAAGVLRPAAGWRLLAERLAKEVLHELGHTSGLIHCPDRRCAMALSLGSPTSTEDGDAKRACLRAAAGRNSVRPLNVLQWVTRP